MYQKLCVGEITNTHGIRGEVKVIPLTDDVSAFDNIKKVSIDNKEYEIESYREHKSVLLVKFRGYDDINLVERLKGKFLEVDRNELEELQEGKYYICDIIGLKVIDNVLGELGTINDVQATGSNDIYIIEYNNKPLCIPALVDVIEEVNIKEGYMKIKLPKGLID